MLISEIKTPTLILWGEQDSWTPVEFAHKFNNDIDNSSLIIYPNAGHVVMEEAPELSATDVLDFLFKKDWN